MRNVVPLNDRKNYIKTPKIGKPFCREADGNLQTYLTVNYCTND